MVKRIVKERIIESDEYKPLPTKVITRRRVPYTSSVFPLGLILAIVFVIIAFIYYGSHRVVANGWGHVIFTSSFSIVSWFYWIIVVLIAIIIWQMLD